MNVGDKCKEPINKKRKKFQGGMIFECQSTEECNSSLVLMMEEGRNNRGKSSHHGGYGLDVIINK